MPAAIELFVGSATVPAAACECGPTLGTRVDDRSGAGHQHELALLRLALPMAGGLDASESDDRLLRTAHMGPRMDAGAL